MKTTHLELLVGIFLAVGLASLAYLSIRIARKDFIGAGGYEIHAVFTNCSGLRAGASVMIAGVDIGRVKRIVLHDYEADVDMMINRKVCLQKDTIASIKTKGLIGEKYIELTPGGADEKIAAGGTIHDTEPAMDIENLISKFVQGNVGKSGGPEVHNAR